MTGSTIDLPDGPSIRAFQALVDALKEYGPLAGAVKTWAAWDGDGVDVMQMATGMLPYVGLSPVEAPNDPMGEGRDTLNVRVAVEVAVPGVSARPFLNLWDAIHDALVRSREWRGEPLLCSFKTWGRIYHHRVVSPPMGAFRTAGNEEADFLYGVGEVFLKVSRTS